MKLCIATPVFDDCLRAVNLLITDLKNQTYGNFQHVLISNGLSPKIKELVDKLEDKRFFYCEIPYESTIEICDLVSNLGKRRNFVLKNFEADRYIFLDADFEFYINYFFGEIAKAHDAADVLTANVFWSGRIFPEKPIKIGNLDIACYSISNRLAKKYDYPTDYNKSFGVANDFRFYSYLKEETHHHIDVMFGARNGRQMYQTVSSLYGKRKKKS